MKHHSHRGFTLIELLTVIAIIAIIAGMLMPALTRTRVTAKRALARSTIVSLSIAMKGYYNEYGTWPILSGVSSETALNTNQQSQLMQVLTGDRTLTLSVSGNPPANPRGISFIDFKPSDLLVNAGVTNMVDPWKHNYVIIFDVNGDGQVTPWTGANPVSANFVIYSLGESSTTNTFIKSW